MENLFVTIKLINLTLFHQHNPLSTNTAVPIVLVTYVKTKCINLLKLNLSDTDYEYYEQDVETQL